MNARNFNVLFLCTGNSARSIMAEAALRRHGAGRLTALSAGSHPRGELHPMTIRLLGELGFDPNDFSSKSWDVFTGPDAPVIDLVITVCDNAADEACPVWPGHPVTAHWGLPDPAREFESDDRQWQAFQTAYTELDRRIKLLAALPMETLDRPSLQAQLEVIGQSATMGAV